MRARSLSVIFATATAALLLAACTKELNERNVRELIDAADHAFLSGHASDICSLRSDEFQLTGMTFELAKGRTVRDLAEADAVEAERHEGGERVSGKVIKMNAKEFCRMAVESRESYRRANLVRTSLAVRVAPDRKSATAVAHYVIKVPEYAYSDSSLSPQDRVEQQTGTLQTETDEESVIVRSPSGDLVFASTRATSKQFRVPKERDSRL
jgi:hypothetical protein